MALKAALIFQGKFNAHITGISACGTTKLSRQVRGWLPDSVHQALSQAESELNEDVARKWSNLVERSCIPELTHWRQLPGEANNNVIVEGRFYDLIFVGQYDLSTSDRDTALHPDRIALLSGRPVVHIPQTYDPGPVSDHLVVAWDGKRAAARALSDALNLLGEAQRVTVLTVGAGAEEVDRGMDRLLLHLSRHNTAASHRSVAMKRKGHQGIAEALMGACAELRPDVLVMGAYEHSKFREDTMGGVTETILSTADFPIWMAH